MMEQSMEQELARRIASLTDDQLSWAIQRLHEEGLIGDNSDEPQPLPCDPVETGK